MSKLRTALLGISAATIAFSGNAMAQEVRLLAFEGCADDAWRVPFEETSGCKVVVSYVGGVDEMFAKMAGSEGADFDLVSIDTSLYPRYAEAGLLQPFVAFRIFFRSLRSFQDQRDLSARQGRLG